MTYPSSSSILEQEDNTLLCESYSQLKEQFDKLQSDFNDNTKENTKLISKNQNLVSEIKALGENLADSLGKNEDFEKKFENVRKELKEVNGKKWSLEQSNCRLEQNLSDARCDQLELTRKLEKKEKIAGKLNEELSSSENGINEAKKELHKLNNELKNLRLENEKVVDLNHQLNDDIENIKNQQSSLNSKFESTLKDQENEIKRLKADLDLSKAEILRKDEKIKSNLINFESTEVNVCQLNIKLKQYEEDKNELLNQRAALENSLSEVTSMKERADHNYERLGRKFDFLQDELDQQKNQYDKERNKFEGTVRENITLSEQVTTLKMTIETLSLQLKESNQKSNKTTDRLKEKIKHYHKNINNLHGQEVSTLHETIKNLEIKLKLKEKEKDLEKNVEQKKEKESSAPQPIVIHQKSGLSVSEKRKMKELENKIDKMSSETIQDKIVLDQLDTKVKTLEAEKKMLLEERNFSEVSIEDVSNNSQGQRMRTPTKAVKSVKPNAATPMSSSPRERVVLQPKKKAKLSAGSSISTSSSHENFARPLTPPLKKKMSIEPTKIDQILAKHKDRPKRTPLATRKVDNNVPHQQHQLQQKILTKKSDMNKSAPNVGRATRSKRNLNNTAHV